VNEVVVIDYGMGNIKSVLRGVEKVGGKAVLSGDPEKLRVARRLILPGVGAFADGMTELRRRNLDSAILDFVKTGQPMLGICLGMQLLFDGSDEYGDHEGLGLISGRVVHIPTNSKEGRERKIPHIGWCALKFSDQHRTWKNTILENINEGDFFYFVHSLMTVPKSGVELLAHCEYEKQRITAAVMKGNVVGTQFHPEKSGEIGLKILSQFVNF
jgi:glutamine amidotransferase